MSRKLKLSQNKVIAGVCAGLAEYFSLDITLVRILYTLVSIFTVFSGVLVYIILWLVLPPSNRYY